MNITAISFSPNGTAKQALENVLDGMGEEAVWLDMTNSVVRSQKHVFSPDDLIIYSTITAGRLFALNKEIFRSIEGNGAAFAGIAMYGNGYYGVSLKQLESRAKAQGFHVVGLAACVGQHAGNGRLAAGRPDAQDAEQQKEFGRLVLKKAKDRDYSLKQPVRAGWSDPPLYNVVIALRHMMQGSDYTLPPFLKSKRYTEKCIHCGLCERRCPAAAIRLERQEFDLGKCIGCYRCINSCPVHAIEQDSSVMGKIMEDFGKRAAQRRHEGERFL